MKKRRESQKRRIYRHYIEHFYATHSRAKEIGESLIYLQWPAGPQVFHDEMENGMIPLFSPSKVNGGAYKTYLLSDGRVLECNLDWDGKSNRVHEIRTDILNPLFLFHGVIYRNMQDWNDYAIPMSPGFYWNA